MNESDSMIGSRWDTATASGPFWLRFVQDRRRYERLLGLVLWITLFAVLFNFGR